VLSNLSPFGGWVRIFPTYNLCDNNPKKSTSRNYKLDHGKINHPGNESKVLSVTNNIVFEPYEY